LVESLRKSADSGVTGYSPGTDRAPIEKIEVSIAIKIRGGQRNCRSYASPEAPPDGASLKVRALPGAGFI
jgi:hypothetical protein